MQARPRDVVRDLHAGAEGDQCIERAALRRSAIDARDNPHLRSFPHELPSSSDRKRRNPDVSARTHIEASIRSALGISRVISLAIWTFAPAIDANRPASLDGERVLGEALVRACRPDPGVRSASKICIRTSDGGMHLSDLSAFPGPPQFASTRRFTACHSASSCTPSPLHSMRRLRRLKRTSM